METHLCLHDGYIIMMMYVYIDHFEHKNYYNYTMVHGLLLVLLVNDTVALKLTV